MNVSSKLTVTVLQSDAQMTSASTCSSCPVISSNIWIVQPGILTLLPTSLITTVRLGALTVSIYFLTAVYPGTCSLVARSKKVSLSSDICHFLVVLFQRRVGFVLPEPRSISIPEVNVDGGGADIDSHPPAFIRFKIVVTDDSDIEESSG